MNYQSMLKMPSKPVEVFWGQPLTQTAFPFCIAIISNNYHIYQNQEPLMSW